MTLTVAIPAAGEMGAGLGAVLAAGGARVVTETAGRSDRTRRRAAEAGMESVDEAELAAVDIFLSVVPPGVARDTARRIGPHLARQSPPPLYIDCNAISPAAAREVGESVEAAGAPFVDGGIIGSPPAAGRRGPKLYLSGSEAGRAMPLADYGLDVRIIDGDVGAASALKMSYGGLTKGLTGITAALFLAAERHGVGEALGAELADSQAALLKRAGSALPDMFPKAHRWIAEMEAIADFIGEDHGERAIWQGLARLYERLAANLDGQGAELEELRRFLRSSGAGG